MTLAEARNNLNKKVLVNDEHNGLANSDFLLKQIICAAVNGDLKYTVGLLDVNKNSILVTTLDKISEVQYDELQQKLQED